MGTLIATYCIFFLLTLAWTLAVLPFVKAWAKPREKLEPTFVLSVPLGLSLGLLFFSLLAKVIPYYEVAFPVSVLVLGGLARIGSNFLPSRASANAAETGSPDKVLFCYFVLLITSLLALRFYFPNIEVISENMGGEKLYNFQYQQAFVFGKNYPPEHLWYLGSQIKYYILPKALPGLTSYFMAKSFSAPMTGGLTFVLGDCFFIALGCVSVAAFSYTALGLVKPQPFNRKMSVALFLGTLPLLAAPARAFVQVFEGKIDFWSLSRIIPNTINEYPFWNFVFADNHAHSNVIFLQVTFWACFLAFLLHKGSRGWLFALLNGCLLGALLYSNTHSVVINVVIFSPLVCYLLYKECIREREFKLIGFLCAFVFVFGAVTYTVQTGDRPQTELYFVHSEFASSLANFTNVQASVFAIVFLIAVCLPKESYSAIREVLKGNSILKVILAVAVLSAVLGYPVVSLCLLLGCFVLAYSVTKNDLAGVVAASPFLLWIFPEMVGYNLDYGAEHMRVNTVFKFYFEAFYAVPLFLVIAFWNLVNLEYAFEVLRKARVGLVIVLLGTLLVQWKSAWARIERSADEPALDGIAYFQKEYPADYKIAQHLAELPSDKIVVAEECGVPPKLTGYFPAGRIAAVSARRGLCGWGHHVTLYHKKVELEGFKGENNVHHITKRERWIQTLLDTNMPQRDIFLKDAVQGLKSLGVTHFVVGHLEKSIHPGASVTEVAKSLGRVVVQEGELGLVELQ